MTPSQSWARAIVAVTDVIRHPGIAEEVCLIQRQADLVSAWAREQKRRLSAWSALGAEGRSPLESFEDWRARRGL